MKTVIAAMILSLALCSCATITRGTTQALTITSDPTGVDVRLSTGLSCQTPCALEVKRRPGFVVTAEKEGYRTVTTNVVSSISGGGGTAMAGNLLLGGVIGAGVDASNGSMNELAPNPLHIVLEPQPPTSILNSAR